MKSQNKQGLIFFLLAFAIVVTVFSFFIPKTSNPNNSKPSTTDEKQKPWEIDWSHAKQNKEPKQFSGKADEELAFENSQGYSNNDVSNATDFGNSHKSTYSSPKPTHYDSSYYKNESNQYVYQTQPTDATNSRSQTTDYSQDQALENTTRSSNYNNASSFSNDSYSAPMPQRQPSTITNCDGAGCWGSDGTRYNRGAGDTYFPSTGGSCQSIGGQMQCN